MKTVRCRKCGLPNLLTDSDCRRCGTCLGTTPQSSPDARPESGKGLLTILIFAAIAAGSYYIYSHLQVSVGGPGSIESQANQQPATSRAVEDRERSRRIANAVGAGNSLAAHEQRVRETENMVNNLTNSSSR